MRNGILLGLFIALSYVSTQVFAAPTSITLRNFPGNLYGAAVPRPNTKGITHIKLPTLNSRHKPITLMNFYGENQSPPASVIVLEVNSVHLDQTLELLGEPAELLILSKGNATCNGCVVKGFHRVSLAISDTSPNIGKTTATVGKLVGKSRGIVNLNGLYAPGVLAFDVLAEQITINAAVNLNERVRKTSSGAYAAQLNGRYSMGSGELHLMAADKVQWDYDQRTLLKLPFSHKRITINGNINAKAIKLDSYRPAVINAELNTRTDLQSVSRYHGRASLVDEQVHIASYGSSDNLRLKRNIESEVIQVMTKDDLIVDSSANIVGHRRLNLIAGDHLTHKRGKLDGNNVTVQACTIDNQSDIHAFNGIQLKTTTEGNCNGGTIYNRNGGNIQGRVVRIEANAQMINGGQAPFAHYNDLYKVPLNYLDTIDPTKVGTYYAMGIERANDNKLRLNDSSGAFDPTANIHGRQVFIKAWSVQNINPYYEFFKPDEALAVNLDRIVQVQITAEDKLNIQVTNSHNGSIINSSALMGVQNDTGILYLNAPSIVNERYRIFSALHQKKLTGGVIGTSLETLVTVYSPPALLFSMGKLQAVAPKQFVNSVGYVEVFDQALFQTPLFKDIGLENQKISDSSRYIEITNCRPYFWKRGVGHVGGEFEGDGLDTGDCGGYYQPQGTIIANPNEVDSLMYVRGQAEVRGNNQKSDSYIGNYSPIKAYINKQIEEIKQRDFASYMDGKVDIESGGDSSYSLFLENERNYAVYSNVTNISYISEEQGIPNKFKVTVRESAEFDGEECQAVYNDYYNEWDEECEDFDDTRFGVDDTKTYTVFDELKEYYQKFKGWFAKIFNELKWW